MDHYCTVRDTTPPEDFSSFERLLKKISVEATLNAEMTHHLGYEKKSVQTGNHGSLADAHRGVAEYGHFEP